MKKKYEEKLAFARKLIPENFPTCKEEEEKISKSFGIIDPIVKTGDIDVLPGLFDFFIEEKAHTYDFCEALDDMISAYFSEDQVLQVFYQKFDALAEKNPERCAGIVSRYFFYQESDYEKFREMFNTVRSKHFVKSLEELKRRLKSNVGWIDKEKDRMMVYALEEDMKKW
ncbi:MAG: hypothetical protein LBI81_03355 [Puniceicoccales bacterium]|jgi:hypothetical protein|nr:hypothetical protein [Puniceicoccales bacterium]